MSKKAKECLRCGKCCRETFIEDVYEVDLLREPKLKSCCRELQDLRGQFTLKTPCPFMEKCGGRDYGKYGCGIYPTRPNICVSHVPGTQDCCPQYDSDDQEY